VKNVIPAAGLLLSQKQENGGRITINDTILEMERMEAISMDEDEDDSFLKKWSDVIEKSGETVNCPNCRKKINWKDTPHENIPGVPLPIPFCNEICKEQFIDGQIKYHEDILRDLYELKPGLLKCPNCGKDALSVVLRDVPFVNIVGDEFVGIAVHKEVMGANGKSVPECYCDLDEEDWRKIFG